MKYRILFILLLLPGFLFADMWFSSLEYYTSAHYDGSALVIPMGVEVTQQGEASAFFITLSGGQSNLPENRVLSSNEGATAPYQLYNDPSEKMILKDLVSMTGEDEVLVGYIEGGRSTAYLEYYFYMDGDLYAPYGYLRDDYTISLYRGTVDNYTFQKSVPLQVAITVDRKAFLSVVPQGGAFNESSTNLTMDFGFLTPRAERSADILVKANLPYTLSISSENGSILTQADGKSRSEIPYQCLVNGNPVALRAGRSVDIGAADISQREGDRYQMQFIIGDFWDIQAGTFEDTIQITLAAW